MKYVHQEKVNPEIAARSKRDIEAVNQWIDNMHGTVIGIKRIRSGQARPYADSVDEAIIFCHQPNSLTTGAPLVRLLSKDDARALAQIFVGKWSDDPKFLETRLTTLEPVANPCGLEEHRGEYAEDRGLHAAWRVVITSPYTD